MADIYKGLTIQFGADTTGLSAALRKLNGETRKVTSELQKVERALKFNPGNADLIRQKQLLLAKQADKLRTKLEALRKAEAQIGDKNIESDQYRSIQREIIETSSKLEHLEDKAKDADRAIDKIGNAKGKGGGLGKVAGVAGAAAATIATAAAAAGVALVGVGVKAVQTADELQKQADVTGVSAERLQELQYAGANLGVELDTIVGAQAKLTKSMDAARGGEGKQAEAFKALGINVKDAHGQLRDAPTVMGEAFTALGKVKNETERNALAQKIFGKSAKDLNPLIRAGGDELKRLADQARKSGAVMSNDTVGGLDALGDAVGNIKSSAIGLFGSAIKPLMDGFMALSKNPQVVAAFNEIKTAMREVWTEIQTQAGPEFKKLGTEIIPLIVTSFKLFASVLRASAPAIGLIARFVVVTIRNFVALESTVKRAMLAFMTSTRGAQVAMGGLLRSIGNLVSGAGAKYRSLVSAASNAFGRVYSSAKSAFGKVASFISGQLARIRGFFSRLVLKLPHIKLPHFRLNGSFSLKPPRVPTVGVDWYAKGGSFAPGMPQLIGVGDQRRGYEHVLRDDQIVALMKRALGEVGGRRFVQNITIEQPVQSYAETRRAMRHAQEAIAW